MFDVKNNVHCIWHNYFKKQIEANRQDVVVIEIYPLPRRVSERPHKTAIIDDFGYDANSLRDISMIAVQDSEDSKLIDVLYER